MTSVTKKANKKYFFIPSIVLVLIAAFIVRILLSPFGTLSLDQNTFIAWSKSLADGGFSKFYNGWSDYFPGYLYVLWGLGKLSRIVPFFQVLLYKLPAIFSDILVGYLIYRIVKSLKEKRWALVAASFYLFNPAILANSSLWGQIDSIPALFSLLSIWLVTINPVLSSLAFGLGVSVKPQVAYILPALLFVMFREKWKPYKIFFFGIISFVVFILLFVPFQNMGNFVSFVLERISISYNQYPYTSVNTFNFWGFFGLWQKDSQLFASFGLLVYLASFLYALYKVRTWNSGESKYILTAILFLSSSLFFTRVHERHLLLGFPALIISASILPEAILVLAGLSTVYIFNLLYSFNWITYDFIQVIPEGVIKLLSALSVLLFVYLLYLVSKGRRESFGLVQRISWLKSKLEKKEGVGVEHFPKVRLSSRNKKIFLAAILLFSLISRLAWLDSPKNEYFDEVYHAFTARIILHGDPKAWEWWNPHPTGFAYEWTHPPLAKLGMVVGMLLFGENSFGWRVPGAILGTGCVFLVWLIAKKLFKDEVLALFASFVFSLDGLVLVMSRIAMNDTYHLFFILLAFYLFTKNKNFFSAISYGLALSSKWSAIWAIPIFGLWWLSQKRKIEPGFIWFLILPPLIYLASYTLLFTTGHGLDIFWGMQKQMWWYHTGLRATHPYTSAWWSWPLLVRPIYLYTSEEVGGFVSRIYDMGNPVIFWFGLVSIIISAVYSFVERNKKLGFVIFSYLIFFAAWAASPRIMFLYHYLPSIPFMAIATGYVLRKNIKLGLGVLAVGFLTFIYFYPHWAGLSVPLWLDRSYYWFPSWR